MIAVIINPISGTGGRPEVARQRAEKAAALLTARGLEPQIFLTEGAGHARELATAAVSRGSRVVVAWGGDGTVNEVGSALAFTAASLGIIPSGSGNGLARELGLPTDPDPALEVALTGRDRVIDAGELDGRLFFNVAGIGIDANVAHRFAAGGMVRRGFWRYAEITLQELFAFTPREQTITTEQATIRATPMLVAIANATQYGNGFRVAPDARLDDGLLDVVVVGARHPLAAMVQLPRMVAGNIRHAAGVQMMRATHVRIASAGERVLYHVDGEPGVGGADIAARVHPGALRVRVAV